MGIFLEEFLDQGSGFVSFLEEAEDLVYFIGHDVSVLVLLVFLAHFFLAVSLRVVFLVLIVHDGLGLAFLVLGGGLFLRVFDLGAFY